MPVDLGSSRAHVRVSDQRAPGKMDRLKWKLNHYKERSFIFTAPLASTGCQQDNCCFLDFHVTWANCYVSTAFPKENKNINFDHPLVTAKTKTKAYQSMQRGYECHLGLEQKRLSTDSHQLTTGLKSLNVLELFYYVFHTLTDLGQWLLSDAWTAMFCSSQTPVDSELIRNHQGISHPGCPCQAEKTCICQVRYKRHFEHPI